MAETTINDIHFRIFGIIVTHHVTNPNQNAEAMVPHGYPIQRTRSAAWQSAAMWHRVLTRGALLACWALALGFAFQVATSRTGKHPVTVEESQRSGFRSNASNASGKIARNRSFASEELKSSKSQLQNILNVQSSLPPSNFSSNDSNDSFLGRLSAVWKQQSNWAEIREANAGTPPRCEKLGWSYLWGPFRSGWLVWLTFFYFPQKSLTVG